MRNIRKITRTSLLTDIINKTSKAPVKIQKNFVTKQWNKSVSNLRKIAKDVKVVNKRIVY